MSSEREGASSAEADMMGEAPRARVRLAQSFMTTEFCCIDGDEGSAAERRGEKKQSC